MNDEQLLARIRSEYLEMPGLRLTPPQAARLLGLDATTCRRLFERLANDRFLYRSVTGMYLRVADAPVRVETTAPRGAARADDMVLR